MGGKKFLSAMTLIFMIITIMLGIMLFIREGNILQALSFLLYFSMVWGFPVVFACYFFTDIGEG